ncbi:RNA polymerase sigma factor [Chitinophaga niabensis]|uniref:RNA polymerase sigma-70 factor, ECF subfamily n=1 Tax=Chitinophaga niabensis TaxID=536979 RepID=A0A1N6FHD1_9BACT|nr:sigma-70 family RNA polymerase sigma factor [Chitinophaga niabensis]SIN94679.1 RNA polymerase sigma-70 factor, ECF subfamily [Chitinophaga niabensis]
MKNYSDVQLLKMLREDSEQAFREIYDRYWKVLYETAFRKTTADDACDLVQDIFLYLWKNRHTIFLEVQLNTYLQAALRHKIIDLYRLRSVRERYYAQIFPSGALSGNEYELKELNQVIRSAINRMPSRMREIFLLNRDGDLPSAAIAEKLSLSDQTIRNQISTAIQRIRLAVDHYQRSK